MKGDETPPDPDVQLERRKRGAIRRGERLMRKYGGDLFKPAHAWRSGECKWCGVKGSRISDNRNERCPG